MCGLYTTVTVDESIDLPHFPDELEQGDIRWQSKEGLDVYSGPYRVTADGRLERKETEYRDKTDEEKQAEAEKWGCDSWDEYVQIYEDHDTAEKDALIPPELDWDPDEDGYDDAPPTIRPSEQTVKDTFWVDHNQHGTFEIHHIVREGPTEFEEVEMVHGVEERPCEWKLDVFFEYELRFTRGDLDEVVFMGDRHSSQTESDIVEQIEEWREWKEDRE